AKMQQLLLPLKMLVPGRIQENCNFMMMNKRTFSKEEKLRIIKEASEQGVKAVLEKYAIYPATYYSWKNKLEDMGKAGLE
ncbi:MAG: transposase, partial [Bacteroidales bacterium]